MRTYREELLPGRRVRVRAGQNEGTDREFNGRLGTVISFHGSAFVEVDFDRPPKDWPNPAIITAHNLQLLRKE